MRSRAKPSAPAKALPRRRGADSGSVQELACHDCGDLFERLRRPGPAPSRCPECSRIRKLDRDRRRHEEKQARKLSGLPETVSCQSCGKVIEGYRRGRRGGVPRYCRACFSERRRERNRRPAERSFEIQKAGGPNRADIERQGDTVIGLGALGSSDRCRDLFFTPGAQRTRGEAVKLDWTRCDKRLVVKDGSGCRWTAEAEVGGLKVQARIVTRPHESPERYRLALCLNGAELPETGHERLRWAQEAAAEYCDELARLESTSGG